MANSHGKQGKLQQVSLGLDTRAIVTEDLSPRMATILDAEPFKAKSRDLKGINRPKMAEVWQKTGYHRRKSNLTLNKIDYVA